MLGRRIAHPPSTNFNDDFTTPTAKRLKTYQDAGESPARYIYCQQQNYPNLTSQARWLPDEIAASEAESNNDDVLPPVSRGTELESSLPLVKPDEDVIAEYEATKPTGKAEIAGLHERLGERKWVQGKSSIYVDAFNLALETVLEEERQLFDEVESAVFDYWRKLSYEAQYLYVRLFLRKTAAWHRINRLRYYSDIADLTVAVRDLLLPRTLPESTIEPEERPENPGVPTGIALGTSFAFAEGSGEHITSLEEASGLLFLDELKTIAKDAKVQGKNKRELLQALRRNSGKQSGLGWRRLERSETEESLKPAASTASEDWDSDDPRVNRDTHYVRKILADTGDCIRLSAMPLRLFERVHLVFYRSTEWTEKSLTTIILARISRRNFPEYIISRSTNIFPSRAILLEFEAAVRTQFRVDSILELSGAVAKEGSQKVMAIFEEVYPRWRALVAEEQLKEERLYETGEGAYLRRFSPAWVYTRIIHKGLAPLARLKEHKREHSTLAELLEQRLFHAARRGAWYQRKALLEEHYIWALEPSEGRSEEVRKKHWKRIALQTCEEGLQDRECHLTYHHDLQKRITKLEKSLRVAKRLQHDFGHVVLTKPEERFVEGVRIEREGSTGDSHPPGRGAKTIWLDEREGGGECGVEAMCLGWYRSQGWKGYHSEGGIIRTLFGFLFYDILFHYVPNVFQTAYQTCPLDLHTDAFFPSRLSLINHRLAAISNGSAPTLFREAYGRESPKQTCVVGIDWTYRFDDLLEILECFGGAALATICRLMAEEYQARGGGVPDLFMWRPETKEIMFAEVKSENDRLSDTQRLWIHVLAGAGIRVELCNAVAKEVRVQA